MPSLLVQDNVCATTLAMAATFRVNLFFWRSTASPPGVNASRTKRSKERDDPSTGPTWVKACSAPEPQSSEFRPKKKWQEEATGHKANSSSLTGPEYVASGQMALPFWVSASAFDHSINVRLGKAKVTSSRSASLRRGGTAGDLLRESLWVSSMRRKRTGFFSALVAAFACSFWPEAQLELQ